MNRSTLVEPTQSQFRDQCWQIASWQDYVDLREDNSEERIRLFFNERWLWLEMGNEGINHSEFSDLFTMIILCLKQQKPERKIKSLGRCQLEKVGKKAAAPDLVIYLGDDVPQWQVGDRRFIDLDRHRVPDLVGEISDTTLATDLDEKKRLYADLGIPEYWVIDVRGRQVWAFLLQDNGGYQQSAVSQAFEGLAIELLEKTVDRLATESNTDTALWFAEQIRYRSEKS